HITFAFISASRLFSFVPSAVLNSWRVPMRRAFPLALCLLLFSASLTFAQAVPSGTGAINGKVTDASDAVMPGVTVTITSPQQMGARTSVTDADGTYRFT